MIQPGAIVILSLQDPRQQVWGLLRALDPAGITAEGLDIESFEGWSRCVLAGGDWRSQISVSFFPMRRVQRVLLDRGDARSPSFSERFEARLGRSLGSLLDSPEAER